MKGVRMSVDRTGHSVRSAWFLVSTGRIVRFLAAQLSRTRDHRAILTPMHNSLDRFSRLNFLHPIASLAASSPWEALTFLAS
jgi:hypothetical protein